MHFFFLTIFRLKISTRVRRRAELKGKLIMKLEERETLFCLSTENCFRDRNITIRVKKIDFSACIYCIIFAIFTFLIENFL